MINFYVYFVFERKNFIQLLKNFNKTEIYTIISKIKS